MTPDTSTTEIPEPLRLADARLAEYGRWARTSGGGSNRPETLDRMYIREADRKESLEAFNRRRQAVPRPPLMPTPDAMVVQQALQHVDEIPRFVLNAIYVSFAEPEVLYRKRAKWDRAFRPEDVSLLRIEGLEQFDGLYRALLVADARGRSCILMNKSGSIRAT